jgi:hypothetical protein
MSERKKQKTIESPGVNDAPRNASDKEPPLKEEPKKKLDYVFKIVPADPKNSFDFEDVADK